MLKKITFSILSLLLLLEVSSVGYFVGQNSVEAVKIPVFVDVPVTVEAPEKFEDRLSLAVYLDRHIEIIEEGKEPSAEGLEFIVTFDYSPVPGLGYEEVMVTLLLSDGSAVQFELTVPGGKFRYSMERKGPKPPSEEGF